MTLERILKNIVIAGIIAVAAITPTVIAGDRLLGILPPANGLFGDLFFPFITGKGFFFRIVVELIVGAWVVLAYRDPTYRSKQSYILYALGGLVGVMAVADMFSPNPAKSIWSNFERMEGLVTLVHLLAYFIVSVSVLTTARLWEKVFAASLAGSVYVGLFGLLQYGGAVESYQSATRVESTFGNAAYLAVYALINAFFATLLLVRARGPWTKLVQATLALTLVLNLFILYYTGTRGTMLGLVVGIMVTMGLLALERERRARFLPWAFGVVLVVILAASSLVMFQDSAFVKGSPVLSRFTPNQIIHSFTDARFPVWGAGIQGFLDRPVFGWGQESFNYVFNAYYDPKMYAQEAWFDRAHNVFLDWLVAGGILGLLAYLALFGSALWYLWRRSIALSHIEKSLVTGLLVAYFIHNIFVFDNLMSYVLFVLVLGFVHTLAVTEEERLVGHVPRPGKQAARPRVRVDTTPDITMAVVVGVCTIGVMWAVNHDAIAQNKTLINALRPPEPGAETLQELQRVFASGQAGDIKKLTDFLDGMLTEERLAGTIKTLSDGTVKTVDHAAVVVINAAQAESLAQFEKAIAYGSLGTAEAREHLIMRAAAVLGSPYVNDEIKRAFVTFATKEIAEQAEELPDDARYQYMAGSFITKTEGVVKVDGVAPGETYYLRALALSPKKQMFLIDLGELALSRKEYPRALEYYKTAYELAPENTAARIAYAAGAIRAGENVLADELLAPLSIAEKAHRDIVRAYVLAGRYEQAVAVLRAWAALEPDNAAIVKQIAAVYVDAGRRRDAIKELRRVIELDPAYQEQGEYFIEELEAGRNP